MSHILSNQAWDDILDKHAEHLEANLTEIAEFCRDLDRDYLRYVRQNYGVKQGKPLRIKLPARYQK